MSDRWPRKRVAEIAHHSLGKMLDKAKNKGEPRPYLRNLNVRWFDFDLSDVLEMRFLPSEVERYSVRKGDVLVCEGGYPGRAAVWERDEPIFFQKALHRVRFHEPDIATWFVYFLLSKNLDGTLSDHFNGAGIQHFTGESLARFEIPLPAAEERERIVGALDEAFAGIATARANAERNLRNARALFDSHADAVFFRKNERWTTRKLREVCSIARGGSPRPIAAYLTDASNGVNWVKIGDATASGKYIFRTEDKILPEGVKRSRMVHDGDFLLSNSMSFGRPYIMRTTGCIHDGWLVLSDTAAHLNQDFLYHVLGSRSVYEQFDRLAAGSTVRNLNVDLAGRVEIPVPSLDEQRMLAWNLELLRHEVERLGELYQRKLAALDELKQSLLHHAFTGQLTERTAAALGA